MVFLCWNWGGIGFGGAAPPLKKKVVAKKGDATHTQQHAHLERLLDAARAAAAHHAADLDLELDGARVAFFGVSRVACCASARGVKGGGRVVCSARVPPPRSQQPRTLQVVPPVEWVA